MRIIFVGASRFGLRCLDAISNLNDISVIGVITNRESFKISYNPQGVRNVLYADFGQWALMRDMPYYIMTESMKEPALKTWLSSQKPDLMVVVGWYHLIPRALRVIAPAYGLHASLLPDFSGGAPLVWAMINGEKITGITFFQFNDGVDNGPIVGQLETEIREDDTIATLYARIEEMGLELLVKYLPAVADGTAILRPQDESKRRIFPQRSPEDGLIDWLLPAKRVHDFIRAQTHPYPGAFSIIRGNRLTILESRLHDAIGKDEPVGTVMREENKLLVVCGERSVIEIISMLENGNTTSPRDWMSNNQKYITDGGCRFE